MLGSFTKKRVQAKVCSPTAGLFMLSPGAGPDSGWKGVTIIKTPNILIAGLIHGQIVALTLRHAVQTMRRSSTAGRFSSIRQQLLYQALQGHFQELLLSQSRALANTSDATLIELLMKGQDAEQVVSVLGDPPHFPAADVHLVSCVLLHSCHKKKNNNTKTLKL